MEQIISIYTYFCNSYSEPGKETVIVTVTNKKIKNPLISFNVDPRQNKFKTIHRSHR